MLVHSKCPEGFQRLERLYRELHEASDHADIVLTDCEESSRIVGLRNEFQSQACLQSGNLFFEQDMKVFVDLFDSENCTLETVKKIISNGYQRTESYSFSGPETELRDSLCQIVNEQTGSRWVTACARSLSSELHMNALYDAPQEAKVEEVREGAVDVLFFGDHILICCLDRYGSLDSNVFFDRLEQVYKRGAGQVINMGPGGAGIGCQIIFENASTLMQFVWDDVQTLTIGRIPTKISNRKFLECPKNIILKRIQGGPEE